MSNTHTHPLRTPEQFRQELIKTRDTTGLSFVEIAALPRFSPIPFGTLASIYAGRIRLPKKYWKQQNIKSERRIKYPTIEIRRDDPASAAQTLRNAFDKGLITQEYIDRLFDELYIQFPDPCELTTFEELFARKEAQNVDLHATI